MHTNKLLGLLTAPTAVGSGDWLGGVIVMIIMMLVFLSKALRSESPRWREAVIAAAHANAFYSLCIEWLLRCLAVFFHLKGKSMGALAKCLLMLVALLEFQRHIFERLFVFFGVHKSINAAKPPNEKS